MPTGLGKGAGRYTGLMKNPGTADRRSGKYRCRQRKKSEPSVMGGSPFGAGYGNRTRLHGLGSRCITDIRTLQIFTTVQIIAEDGGKFNPFLSKKYFCVST